MSRILVVAHLNHDRIWQFDRPLVAGARIPWGERAIHLGGGGFFTGSQLLALGHEVALVGSLGDDELGQSAWKQLAECGFDLTHVMWRDSKTQLTEILLEPTGERTILTPRNAPARPFTLRGEVHAQAAYINCFNPDAAIHAAFDAIPLVASQFPLSDSAVFRPADLMIGSRGDLAGLDMQALWNRSRALCGPRLRHLVITDGPNPVTVFDGQQSHPVQPAKRVAVRSTIGAGDHFSANLISAILRGLTMSEAAGTASDATARWLDERDRKPVEEALETP